MRSGILFASLLLLMAISPVSGADLVVSPQGPLQVGTDGTAGFSLAVTGATHGISGFYIFINTSGSGIFEISDVTFPEWVKLGEYAPPDPEQGYIRGVDLENQAGSGEGEILLAMFHISGSKAGVGDITIQTHILEDDFGNLYNPAPITLPISVAPVSKGSPGSPGNGQPPTTIPSPTVTPTTMPTTALPTPTPTAPTPAPTAAVQETDAPPVQTTVPPTPVADVEDEVATAPIDTPKESSPPGIFIPLVALLIMILLTGIRREDEVGETP